MIEIQPVIALLAVEAIIASVLGLVVVAWCRSRKRRIERHRADDLVEHLNRTEASRLKHLVEDLSESEAFLPEVVRRETAQAVNQREKALYRHVIRAFLIRDAGLLEGLDHHVHEISEAYCRLLRELSQRCGACEPAELQARIAALEELTEQTQAENAQLRQTLDRALITLDEVSKEYAKMFGDKATAADLYASRARMLEHFRQSAGLGPQEDGGAARASEAPRSR